MQPRLAVIGSIGLAALGFAAGASALQGTSPGNTDVPAQTIRQGFDLDVPLAPSVQLVGEQRRLAYELHLTNFARDPLTLNRLRAEDGKDGTILADLRGPDLEAILGRPGAADARLTIGPGMRAIVYLDVVLGGTSTPAAIRHELNFQPAGAAEGKPATVSGGEITVSAQPLPVLGPPLAGGPWVAVYDPRLERGHRRVIYAVGGRARIPGRHAVDWMKPVGPAGAPQRAEETGLGAEVLAVADAVVAAARDGIAEPAFSATRVPVSLADATGNYIALDLGGGRFAFYEHLMPGLLAKPGDRVRRGQVIARLGSTGQASRPHLHFHVADANSPLGAEGLPYLLTGFETIGSYASIQAFERGVPWLRTSNVEGQSAPRFPTPNAVVRFTSGSGRR